MVIFRTMFDNFDIISNSHSTFWQTSPPLINFVTDACYSAKLSLSAADGTLCQFSVYLAEDSLFFCPQNTTDLAFWTVVKWKVLEKKTHPRLTKSKAFQLSNSHEAHIFYSEKTREFKKWMAHLKEICILRNLEQDFEVIEQIGKGGCSKVYKARLRKTKQMYAVKKISKAEIAGDSNFTRCAMREIVALRKLNHPKIVKLVRVYDDPDLISLVLELLPQGDMLGLMKRSPDYSEYEVKEFIQTLLSTIKYMHSRKIVHRDLKPENLLMNSARLSDFKITDFGLAAEQGVEVFNMRCGSPGYVAPEILKDQTYNHKIDIYSVGIIAYVALTKHTPFPGENMMAVLRSNYANSITFPAKLWERHSKEAANFVQYLTHTEPKARPSARRALQASWLVTTAPSTAPSTDSANLTPEREIKVSKELRDRKPKRPFVIDLDALSTAQMDEIIACSDKVATKAVSIFEQMTKDTYSLYLERRIIPTIRRSSNRRSSPCPKSNKLISLDHNQIE